MSKATLRKRPAAATLQKRPAAAATQKDNRSLTEAISALGRWPKRKMQPKGDAEIAENNLAIRLHKAQKKGIGEDTELDRVLDNLPPPTSAEKAAGTQKDRSLAEAISALGRWPKRKKQPKGDAEIAENNLAIRLRKAQQKGIGEDTELASVVLNLPDIPILADEIHDFRSRFGYVPKRMRNPVGEKEIAENNLARRLRRSQRRLARRTAARNAETSQTDDASQLVRNTETSQNDDASQVVT